MSSITYDDKKYLEKTIKLLDRVEYNEILKILIKNKQKYSINKTGIFFNLKYIDTDSLKELINFVKFCTENRKIFKLEPEINYIYNPEDKKNIHNLEDKDIKYKMNKESETGNLKKKFEFKLDSGLLHKDLDKFKSKNVKEMNFSFKNYLDKISIISNKEFENNEYVYPILNEYISNFEGVNDRIFKKCKNIDRSIGLKNDNNEKILERDKI